MVVFQTEIEGLPTPKRGKVRDIYDLGDKLLLIATDRLSAFDVVLPTPIPFKGKSLTKITLHWMSHLSEAQPHHLVSSNWETIASALHSAGALLSDKLKNELDGRSMLVKKAEPFPIECVVRCRLFGSLWKEYEQADVKEGIVKIHDISLPSGMKAGEKLPHPLFSPAIKASTGHDQNISLDQARAIIGDNIYALEARSLALFTQASHQLQQKGLQLVDTKFEFGRDEHEILLIDEALTSDSSRFWESDSENNRKQSFDKQFVRDWLESIGWNKQRPGPEIPDEMVQKTTQIYREACLRITGSNVE